MGKKKSVVLIVLFTLALAALLFLCFAPAFPVQDGIGSYRSMIKWVKQGSDLDGGYYSVYYPEGVISKEEYETLVVEYAYAQEEAEETGEPSDLEDPAANYKAYKGLYLSTDIYSEETGVSQSFQDEFAKAFRAVRARYEDMGYSDYSVRLQDDYAIRVEIPTPEDDAGTGVNATAQSIFETFASSGGLIFSDSDSTVASKNVLMEGTSRYIERASVGSNPSGSGYAVVLHFTKEGRQRFAEITAELSSSASDGSTATLYVYVGDDQLMGAGVEGELNQDTVSISGQYTTRESAAADAAVINSVLDEDDVFDLKFEAPEYYSMTPTSGDYTALAAAIAFGVLVLGMLVFSLVKYKGMGLAHLYGFLTFILALILCLALIPGIEVTTGGILAITLVSAIMVSCNYFAFGNIKKEFATGKTLTASVKAGYKKSMAFTIDVHIILFLASLAMYLIATGTVKFLALIFTLGIVASAACTLAVTRFCLYVFMAQPKNKIAFVGFKREETEDE